MSNLLSREFNNCFLNFNNDILSRWYCWPNGFLLLPTFFLQNWGFFSPPRWPIGFSLNKKKKKHKNRQVYMFFLTNSYYLFLFQEEPWSVYVLCKLFLKKPNVWFLTNYCGTLVTSFFAGRLEEENRMPVISSIRVSRQNSIWFFFPMYVWRYKFRVS